MKKTILQIPLSRILQVFILQLGIGIFCLFMGLLVLKRDRKKINLYVSSFFIFIFIGVLFNVIYALITDIPVALVLSYLCLFFLFFGPVFLLLFNLIILYSEKIVNIKKQVLILGGYAIILIGWISIQGITIEKSNNYIPYWSLTFYLYIAIALICYVVIPTMYTSIKIYRKFENKELKNKWLCYIVGAILYITFCLVIGFINFYNDPTVRLIFNIFALSLFGAAFLIYHGVGRQLQKKEQK